MGHRRAPLSQTLYGALKSGSQCFVGLRKMKFKDRNLRDIAELVIGDADHFRYRSSSYITQFFDECDLEFVHDGSTRWWWVAERLSELLAEPAPTPNALPDRFVHVLRVLMQKADAEEHDPDRSLALAALNRPLAREGYQAFYGEDDILYVRHIGTNRGIFRHPQF